MTNQQGAPEALRPIARYKIGYHTDEWGVRSSTPGGISDPSGQWVLYKDHLAALASHGQAPAQAAPQQEAQEPVAWYVTGCSRLLDEDEAKAEARHIAGTARAIPLYTAPQADSVLEDAAVVVECGNLYAKVKLVNEAFGTTKVGDKFYAARKQGANHD